MADKNVRVERTLILPVPPDAAWRAVSTSAHLSEWFGARVEIDLQPGGLVTFLWPGGTTSRAVVEDVLPGERLSWRGDRSSVTIALTPVAGETLLSVCEERSDEGAEEDSGESGTQPGTVRRAPIGFVTAGGRR